MTSSECFDINLSSQRNLGTDNASRKSVREKIPPGSFGMAGGLARYSGYCD